MEIEKLLALSPEIRYVATNFGGEIRMRSRPDLSNPSSSESDLYEELLVNPALLNLAGNRGAIDCGGLQFLVVRYGSFFQLIHPVSGGHVSVAIEPSGNPLAIAAQVREALQQQGGRNESYTIQPIGTVRSDLASLEAAPCQGDEGAPEAWLELTPQVAQGLAGIAAGDELIVLTWLDRARRDVLQVHPRGRLDSPLTGVFATRSPDRPNPVGLHRVSVLEVAGPRLRVVPLEAIDGTPIVDIKPVLGPIEER